MNNQLRGNTGFAPDCSTIQIVQGQDITFNVSLTKDGDPFDLTGATVIEARFPKTGGNGLFVSETLAASRIAIVGAAGAGKMSITAPAADTALMNAPGNPELLQDLQIAVTISSKVTLFLLPLTLNIQPQPYPTVS